MSLKYNFETILMEDIVKGNNIQIPTFQRGLVWSVPHQKAFIKNVLKGEPFGVVLLHGVKDNSGKFYKYRLIDGLQRFSTLKKYANNPYDFIDPKHEFESDEILYDMVRILNTPKNFEIKEDFIKSEGEKIKNIIIEELSIADPSSSIMKTWKKVKEKTGYNEYADSDEKFETYINKIKKEIMISNSLKIPAIIYTGPKENLPDLFYNINTGSVSLSKYETFASLWEDRKFKIKDDELIDYIENRYRELSDNSDFEIDIDFDELKTEGITLFEYCYSISQLLVKNKAFNYIFKTKRKSSIDPYGFDLLAVLLGLKINKADKLEEKLINTTPDFLLNLKQSIIRSLRIFNEAIKPWITQINGKTLNIDSNYQIYHMLYSIFSNNFKVDFENNSISQIQNSKAWNKNFKKNAHQQFIYDIITNKWIINRQVTDLYDEMNNRLSTNSYCHTVPKDEMNNRLSTWITENRLSTNKVRVDNTSKIILNYIYKMKIEENHNLKKYFFDNENKVGFDIEHIIPLNQFKQRKNIETWKSTIGNLCYLPIGDNRGKGDKTLYEEQNKRVSFILDHEFLDFVMYPSRNTLAFKEYNDTGFKAAFEDFIKARENQLSKEFCDLMYN